MLAVFLLRLATGLLASLLVLCGQPLNPRFYRAHFLTTLGLCGGAGLLLGDQASLLLWAGLVICFLGSISWSVEGNPGGQLWIVAGTLLLGAALVITSLAHRGYGQMWLWLGDDVTATVVLGGATTAMLLGHSYLIAPGLSMVPLMRALWLLGVGLVLRLLLALAGLWQWTGTTIGDTLETEMILWLAVRWGVGFLLPLVLTWLAYETARIRSTQSATGILYVVVIGCFLGELTAQLLLEKTGVVM